MNWLEQVVWGVAYGLSPVTVYLYIEWYLRRGRHRRGKA